MPPLELKDSARLKSQIGEKDYISAGTVVYFRHKVMEPGLMDRPDFRIGVVLPSNQTTGFGFRLNSALTEGFHEALTDAYNSNTMKHIRSEEGSSDWDVVPARPVWNLISGRMLLHSNAPVPYAQEENNVCAGMFATEVERQLQTTKTQRLCADIMESVETKLGERLPPKVERAFEYTLGLFLPG